MNAWTSFSASETVNMFRSLAMFIKANSHHTDKLQQTSWLKLTIGFRILWKITAMFTLYQQTLTNSHWLGRKWMILYKHVQSSENKLQPTPTGVTRIQQTPTD